MDPLALAQRDRPAQRFAIQAQLNAAPLEPTSLSQRTRKEVCEHLLELSSIHPMSQHAAPRAIMRHRLALEGKQQTQFLLSQVGPMGNCPTTILPGQFRQHSNRKLREEKVDVSATLGRGG